MLRTVNIISFDPIQELVYFVTQCAFVELDLLLFGVPFKKYNAKFFLISPLTMTCWPLQSVIMAGTVITS